MEQNREPGDLAPGDQRGGSMHEELTNEDKELLRRINANFKKMTPEDRRAFTTALDVTALINRIKEDQR